MKKLYWRPKRVSQTALLFVGVVATVGLMAVERLKVETKQPNYEEKIRAATLARQCLDAIRDERLARGHSFDRQTDPADSGLIGEMMTPVTSVPGDLAAKQTSINPNFAAAIVDMLDQAGAREGDSVAVAFSGSFPALNACVCAALETKRLRPIMISSVSASQWGANLPDLLWIDMEKLLQERGLISFRSVSASIGGHEDLGLGLTDEAKKAIRTGIERNGLDRITSETFTEAIDERMAIYREKAGRAPIKAYLNVGGGTVSVGRRIGKRAYKPGLNTRASHAALKIDSVMTRFMHEGVPALHLVEIKELAELYSLPYAPSQIPRVGEGNIFFQEEYNWWLALGLLISILVGMHVFVLSDIGLRFFKRGDQHRESSYVQPAL